MSTQGCPSRRFSPCALLSYNPCFIATRIALAPRQKVPALHPASGVTPSRRFGRANTFRKDCIQGSSKIDANRGQFFPAQTALKKQVYGTTAFKPKRKDTWQAKCQRQLYRRTNKHALKRVAIRPTTSFQKNREWPPFQGLTAERNKRPQQAR